MNKKIATLVIALTLPLTAAAFPGGGEGRIERHPGGDRIERLAEKLNLNDEQKTKLGVVFEEQRAKFEAIRQESRARMQAILSPEQMTKLDELKKHRQEKRHEQWQHKKSGTRPN